MNIEDHIRVDRIVSDKSANAHQSFYTVFWIHGDIDSLTVDGVRYTELQDAVLFMNHKHNWQIRTKTGKNAGFIIQMSEQILNRPELSQLQINEVRILDTETVHRAVLTPGIATRIHTLIEMLDELLTTRLPHREEAIVALILTFFVYCDGRCNIHSSIETKDAKSLIVYRYKKLLFKKVHEMHDVAEYARMLSISPKYLNECVQDTLGYTAKYAIIEQLVMRSRRELKFSDKAIKEIAYELGFSSPEYFSAFCKKHLGKTPSAYRA